MSAKLAGDAEKIDSQATLKARIGRADLGLLGAPADILKVAVHPVGVESYRVNVLMGKSPSTARITHSFFLTADNKGNILTATPNILRLT